MNVLTRWAISVLFLYVLSFLFSAVYIEGLMAAVVAAAVLGVINATVKPIVQIISIPITFVTLGIFYLVVNGLMLMLVAALVPGFSIGGFGTAFFASIVLSLLNSVLVKKAE